MKMMQPDEIIFFLIILFFSFSSHDAKKTFSYSSKVALPEIISSKINHTIFEVHESYTKFKSESINLGGNIGALNDCCELLQLTITYLNSSINFIKDPTGVQDVQAYLSAASTNQYTCVDGLAQNKNKLSIVDNESKDSLIKISKQIDNALALIAKLPGAWKPLNSSSSPGNIYPMSDDGYPKWMAKKELKILEIDLREKYDFVVAQDGSGNFTTIGEALNAIPNGSKKRVVIYIKAGAYYEDLEVRNKNIMFIGDGINKTWIKGNKNVVDGQTIYSSAVLAVVGEGFIAKDLAIENYAGPTKNEAVALRTNTDRSVFYHCRIIGYQDTLYVHSLRQFFRECEIYGTLDFIFGNSAVVFQKCSMYARKPLPNQKNVFTAQGRSSSSEATGISIMESKIEAGSEFIPEKKNFQSFLGRPLREFSRTVIIKSYIGDLIDPVGWTEYDGKTGLDTLYYGEYLNSGPGANTSARVQWPGFKVITDQSEAAQFTAGAFIQGEKWLKKTDIPFYPDLPPN